MTVVAAFLQPYVYHTSLPSLDLATCPFAKNLIAVYKPSPNGRGLVGWVRETPEFALFSTLEPGDACVVVSNKLGYNLPDAAIVPGETVLNLTAPFTPTQFGEDMLAWLDGKDAGQQLAGGGIASKGTVPLSLLPNSGATVTYDSTKQALLVGTGGMSATAPIAVERPCMLVVYTDTYVADNLGFVSLGDGQTGIQLVRTSYGANGAQFQVNSYGQGNIFVEFPKNQFGILVAGNDGSSTRLRINGTLPDGAVQQATSGDSNLLLTIGGAPRAGYVQTIHEIIVLPGYYTFLAQLLEGYAYWRWGMMAQLPDGHPFKNKAPTTGDYYDAFATSDTPGLTSPPKPLS